MIQEIGMDWVFWGLIMDLNLMLLVPMAIMDGGLIVRVKLQDGQIHHILIILEYCIGI